MNRRHLTFALSLATLGMLLSSGASAYTIQKSQSTGVNLNWTSWPMKFNIHSAAAKGVSAAATQAAIRASYQTWQSVTCSYATFSDLGVVNQPSQDNNDRINTNIFVSYWQSSWGGNALGLTRTVYDPNSGKILDADIVYNPNRTWSTSGSAYAIDVQAVATHEIGHEMGLNHSQDSQATMFYAVGAGNTAPRSLAQDDINGICFLYPNGKPKPAECTSPSHCAPGETCTNNKCVAGSTVKKGYGSPCNYSGECKSGVCLKSGSTTFCSQMCTSSACPNGDQCVNLSGGGKACLPGSANKATKKLGDSCQASMDCKSKICVSVPGKGYLCSQKCDVAKNNCPTNYFCANSTAGGLCIPGSKNPPPPPPPPKKKKLGAACTKAGDCDSGLCGNTASGTVCIQFCDKNKANSCPSGYSCIPVTGTNKGACVKSAPPSKKGLGASCTKSSQCQSGICAGEGFCTKLCTPGSNPCGDKMDCVPAGGGQYACSPKGSNNNNPGEEPGGCGVAAPAPQGSDLGHLALLFLLPLLIMARRRR